VYEDILLSYLSDTAKSRILNRDGSYTRAQTLSGKLNGKRFAAQDYLVQLAEGKPWRSAAGLNGEPDGQGVAAGKLEGHAGKDASKAAKA